MKKVFHMILLIIQLLFIVIDCIKLFSPVEISITEQEDLIRQGIISGDKAFISASTDGLIIYDITDPYHPQQQAQDKEEGYEASSLRLFQYQNSLHVIIAYKSKGVCIHDSNNGKKEACVLLGFDAQTSIQFRQDYIIVVGEGNIALVKVEIQGGSVTELEEIKQWSSSAVSSYRIELDDDHKFVFVSLQSDGIAIYDGDKIINKDNNPNILTKQFLQITADFAVLTDQRIIIAAEAYGNLLKVDISALYTNSSPTPSDITYIQFHKINGYTYSLTHSRSSNQIYVGSRNLGVTVFDINDINNIFQIQQFQRPGYSFSIGLNDSGKILIYSNGKYMRFMQLLDIDKELDFPNILNSRKSKHQKTLVPKLVDGEIEQTFDSPFSITISEDDTKIFVAYGRIGGHIYDISGNNLIDPQLDHYFLNPWDDYSDGVTYNDQDSTFYIAGSVGLEIIDMSNYNNPTILSQIVVQGDTDYVYLSKFNQNYIIVGDGQLGIVIYDVSDKTNPIEIQRWTENNGGTVENIISDKTERYILVGMRNYGIVILEMDSFTQPLVKISEYYSGDSEQIILREDEKYAFVSDGLNGITVLKIQEFTNIEHVISIPMLGSSSRIILQNFKNNQFLLATSKDIGILYAFNVTDPENTFLLSRVVENKIQSWGFTITSTNSAVYLTTSNGIYISPMINKIEIYSQFILVDESGIRQEKQRDSNFVRIGEIGKFVLIPYKINTEIKVQSIQYYQNFEWVNQPAWMRFELSEMSLYINCDKEGLLEGQETSVNLIQVHIQLQIQEGDFEESSIPISLEDSKSLYDQLILESYIESETKFVTDKFQPKIPLTLISSNPLHQNVQVMEKVANILEQSIEFIPYSFTVAKSLFFHPKRTDSSIIETNGNTLKIILIIQDTGISRFIDKQYFGSVVYLKNTQDELSLQGPKDIVINNLINDIRIKNATDDQLNNLNFTVIIEDGLNYVETFTNISYSQQSFIKIHEGVSVNQNNTLQKQFNHAYEEGQISVEEEFAFEFSLLSFISPANLDLSYKIDLYNENSEEYGKFPLDYWLIPNAKERKLSGKPSEFYVYSSIKLRIQADDGYSQAYDYLKIKVYNLSFLNIILIIIKYAGPAIGALGLWKYRIEIFQYFLSHRYTYSEKDIKIDEDFVMVIPVLQNHLSHSQFLLSLLDFKKNKEDIYWDEQGNFRYDQFTIQILEKSKDPKIQKAIEKHGIVLQEIEDKTTQMYWILKGLCALNVLNHINKINQDCLRFMIQEGKKQFTYQDWYLQFAKIHYKTKHGVPKLDFPQITINREQILNYIYDNFQKIKEIDIDIKKINPLTFSKGSDRINIEEMQKQVNVDLIVQCLKAQIMGVQLGSRHFPIVSKGVSMHCRDYQLEVIRGYVQSADANLINKGLETSGLQGNHPLPQWLNAEVKRGYLVLYGRPTYLDTGVLNIRIFHSSGFIIRYFTLNILKPEGDDLSSVANLQEIQDSNHSYKNIGSQNTLLCPQGQHKKGSIFQQYSPIKQPLQNNKNSKQFDIKEYDTQNTIKDQNTPQQQDIVLNYNDDRFEQIGQQNNQNDQVHNSSLDTEDQGNQIIEQQNNNFQQSQQNSTPDSSEQNIRDNKQSIQNNFMGEMQSVQDSIKDLEQQKKENY